MKPKPSKVTYFSTIVCIIIGFILIGCDMEMPTFTTPHEPVEIAEDADEVLCHCPSEDIVIRVRTQVGMMHLIIKKGDFDDIDSNPNAMYLDEFEEMVREYEDSLRETPEQNPNTLKVGIPEG